MATCNKCGGYLSDGHRCVGAWRHIAKMMGVALAGALLGVVVVLVLAERPSNSLLAVAGLLFAVLVGALWRETGL
jgi:hypothetical protein